MRVTLWAGFFLAMIGVGACLASQRECIDQLKACTQHRPLEDCKKDFSKLNPECEAFYLTY